MTCTNSSSQPNVGLLPLSIVAAFFIFLRLLSPALAWSGGSEPASRSSRSTTFQHLFDQNRNDVLNLLNHPLQLQLATGELPLGSFRRLVADRAVILEGIESALKASAPPSSASTPSTIQKHVHEEMERHTADANEWLDAAEDAGKTIVVPGIQCYTCGGEHLNIDCPNDAGASDASTAALALRSVLQTSGAVGAVAVLRSYGFCCSRLLDAMGATVGSGQRAREVSQPYVGWLEAHSERWTTLADVCEAEIICGVTAGAGGNHINIDPSSYSLCLSMFYGWIDNEAATTGIRIESNGSSSSGSASKTAMVRLVDALEDLEPGYAAQRDKHSSFVADITGKADAQEKASAAMQKVDAAAAYLEAKKRKNSG